MIQLFYYFSNPNHITANLIPMGWQVRDTRVSSCSLGLDYSGVGA